MAIPISYNIRNLKLRKGLTIMTALGIALTVTTAVFLMALLAGLKKAFMASGDPVNVLVMRKGSTAELSGGFDANLFPTLKTLPGIATDKEGQPIASGEWVVVVVLPRKDGTGEVNVSVRGLMPAGLTLRPSAKLVEGRWFTPGQREVVVGQSIHNRFSGANVGDNLDFAKGQWKVVGVFDSGGTAYDSEIWGDVNQIAADFDRQGGYASAYLRATDPVAADALKHRVSDDQRLKLEGTLETRVLREANQLRWRDKIYRHICGDHHGHRFQFRRHEYDVRGGGVSLARDRNPEDHRIFAPQHSHLVRDRSLAAVAAGSVCRDRVDVAVQRHEHWNRQLPHLQRNGFQSAPDLGSRAGGSDFCLDHGLAGRLRARLACGAAGYSDLAASLGICCRDGACPVSLSAETRPIRIRASL